MKTEDDFWACTVCHSINPRRSDRCYSCHTPREVAGASLAEVSMAPPGPAKVPLPITATFQSSENRAVIVTVAAVLFILSAALALWTTNTLNDLRIAGEGASADRLLLQRLPILAAAPLLGVVALIAYASWISRVVANLPTFGVGYSRVSPRLAFFEPLIPGFGFLAMPARMSEVINKLEGGLFGQALLGLAILFVTVPTIVYVWVIRIVVIADVYGEKLSAAMLVRLALYGGIGVAILLLLAVIWHIEGLCRARRANPKPAQGPA